MSRCPSCGGIIGIDCFNPVECAWITEQQRQDHDRNHYQEGYNKGYYDGYERARFDLLNSETNDERSVATDDDSSTDDGNKKSFGT